MYPPLKWLEMKVVIFSSAIVAAVLSAFFWWRGAEPGLEEAQTFLLLAMMLLLNVLPPLVEYLSNEFDPFDSKNLFLSWFFVVFTLSSISEICFGYYAKSGMVVLELNERIQVRALAAIVLGEAAFIAGGYTDLSARIAVFFPRLPGFSRSRAVLVGTLCIGAGFSTFYLLLASAGGISGFLGNLNNWRTEGVLGGVGYLIFPTTTVLPAGALLIYLRVLPAAPCKMTWSAYWACLGVIVSGVPAMVLGFRVSLVPTLLAAFAIWNYRRRRFTLFELITAGAIVLAALSIYGAERDKGSDDVHAQSILDSIVYRTSGIDTVERVVRQMDRGERLRGLIPGAVESLTILIPRVIWPNKPETSGLAFDDIFFYDFYINRGDPVTRIRSGISTTLIGEELWTGGITMVVLGSLLLGLLTRVASAWRYQGGILNLFVYSIFMSEFFLFVEAPQNTLNAFVMLGAMCTIVVVGLSVRLGRRHDPPSFKLGH